MQPRRESEALGRKRKLVLFLWLINAALCAQVHILVELRLGWASWGMGAVVCSVVGGWLRIYQEEIFGGEVEDRGGEAGVAKGGMGGGKE
ncbi:hypothetical protein EV426DRAFT_713677 [Tirmania nivea]|nr:hypothetical protein EV426DRAFT_713677 [Tirmania nivea]